MHPRPDGETFQRLLCPPEASFGRSFCAALLVSVWVYAISCAALITRSPGGRRFAHRLEALGSPGLTIVGILTIACYAGQYPMSHLMLLGLGGGVALAFAFGIAVYRWWIAPRTERVAQLFKFLRPGVLRLVWFVTIGAILVHPKFEDGGEAVKGVLLILALLAFLLDTRLEERTSRENLVRIELASVQILGLVLAVSLHYVISQDAFQVDVGEAKATNATTHLSLLVYGLVWSVFLQIAILWDRQRFQRGLCPHLLFARLFQAQLARSHFLQLLAGLLVIIFIAVQSLRIFKQDLNLTQLLVNYADATDYQQVVVAVWIAYATAVLGLASRMAEYDDLAQEALRGFGRRTLSRLQDHVLVVGESGLAREVLSDVVLSELWESHEHEEGPRRMCGIHCPLSSETWLRHMQSDTGDAQISAGDMPVHTQTVAVVRNPNMIEGGVELSPGIWFGLSFLWVGSNMPVRRRSLSRVKYFASRVLRLRPRLTRTHWRTGLVGVPTVAGDFADSDLQERLRLTTARLVINTEPGFDISEHLLVGAINAERTPKDRPGTEGASFPAVITAYDRYVERGYHMPGAVLTASSVVVPFGRAALVMSVRLRQFLIRAKSDQRWANRKLRLVLVVEEEHLFGFLDILRTCLERAFSSPVRDHVEVTLLTKDRALLARYSSRGHSSPTQHAGGTIRFYRSGKAQKTEDPWDIEVRPILDSLSAMDLGGKERRPHVVGVLLRGAEAREALHEISGWVRRLRRSGADPDYAPYLVVLGQRDNKQDLLRTLYEYDARTLRQPFHSHPAGFVDRDREGADQIHALAAPHLENTNARTVELTFCLQDAPLEYAGALSLLGGFGASPLGEPRPPAGTRHMLDGWELRFLLVPAQDGLLRMSGTLLSEATTDLTVHHGPRLGLIYGRDADIKETRGLLLNAQQEDELRKALTDEGRARDLAAEVDQAEECAGCPEIGRCPLPITRTWWAAKSLGLPRARSTPKAFSETLTGLTERFLSFPVLSGSTSEAPPRPNSPPDASRGSIEVLIDTPRKRPGLLSFVLQQLNFVDPRPKWRALGDERSHEPMLDLNASFTQPCDDPRYAFDKVYGTLIDRKRVKSSRYDWFRSRDLEPPLTCMVVWVASGHQDWCQYLTSLCAYFDGLYGDGSYSAYDIGVKSSTGQTTSLDTEPTGLLLLYRNPTASGQSQGLVQVLKDYARRAGVLEAPSTNPSLVRAGGTLERDNTLVWAAIKMLERGGTPTQLGGS